VDILHINVQFCLVIGRRVNANAFPELPKPLKQCGACGLPWLPIVQSFG
jgi:hypothetical protein